MNEAGATPVSVVHPNEREQEGGGSTSSPVPPASGSVANPTTPGAPGGLGALRVLQNVDLQVTVELGRTTMPVRELLNLRAGSIVELDRQAGSLVDVMVNGTLLARGEVVVVDDDLAVRITDVVGTER